MTTTSPQPPPEEPSRGYASDPADRSDAAASPSARGRRIAVAVVAVVVVAVVAVLIWLFTAGPLSESAQKEREVESTLEGMSSATSFADFNSFLCAEQRVPQDLVDTISSSGEQTGADLDAMFRETLAGSLPDDLRVTDVEIEGGDATATVEAGSEDADPEQVRMREEDGAWKVCEPGVGMGTVPQAEQPG